MLQDLFKSRYLESLAHYKSFCDDIHEYGGERNARRVFYFIPGINGTAGQVRFILPSLFQKYGAHIYVRCCYLPEFSATRPIWEKYTLENVDRKRNVIVRDLGDLLSRHDNVIVLVSSNGFYDFAHAYDDLAGAAAAGRLRLLWGACAPDRFEGSLWESAFYPLNGFTHNGHRWAACPNHNLLQLLNPETGTSFRWRQGVQKKTFFKIDLESRFVVFNLYWDYLSVGCFNATQAHLVRDVAGPLDIESHVLVAANDGYWQGRTQAEITAVIDRYLSRRTVTFKDASHLWVAAPENITEILDRLEGGGADDAAAAHGPGRPVSGPVAGWPMGRQER